ncbi:hypothetical protein BDV27DRAFT_164898 [Aspergillus caelatus]|uniref:Uncharacterized protein n=1 Tax=Aspergillus caelatus TaxID=61420 RepID=A0A5N6ZHD2_9EURO|nr:uncharacterized protein BDV27DRAFT_164898 [Aspergillus caelatus]KAE8357074.1 hypothetical protein BDV27DRAFT_164898 [Aspergillus caelatus]
MLDIYAVEYLRNAACRVKWSRHWTIVLGESEGSLVERNGDVNIRESLSVRSRAKSVTGGKPKVVRLMSHLTSNLINQGLSWGRFDWHVF